MPQAHVVCKLTRHGGPDPEYELQRVFEVAQDDPKGQSWLATRKPGADFSLRPYSQLLAFALHESGECLALTARIVSRHDALPSTSLARDMYEDFEDVFQAYWEIADVELRSIAYEDLPGWTANGRRRVPDAFQKGQLSFAYWLPESSANAGARERITDYIPVSLADQVAPGSCAPLHGVDFSGARETNGRNEKIWIASWYPDQQFVQLKFGGDYPGFDRGRQK